MLSTIEAVNSVVNNFIWGVPAMICIIGVGLYLSIRTRFLQIRRCSGSVSCQPTVIIRSIRIRKKRQRAEVPWYSLWTGPGSSPIR